MTGRAHLKLNYLTSAGDPVRFDQYAAVRDQRDRAHDIAVALENELAELRAACAHVVAAHRNVSLYKPGTQRSQWKAARGKALRSLGALLERDTP